MSLRPKIVKLIDKYSQKRGKLYLSSLEHSSVLWVFLQLISCP